MNTQAANTTRPANFVALPGTLAYEHTIAAQIWTHGPGLDVEVLASGAIAIFDCEGRTWRAYFLDDAERLAESFMGNARPGMSDREIWSSFAEQVTPQISDLGAELAY